MATHSGRCSGAIACTVVLRTEEEQRGEREGAPECQTRLVDARGDEAAPPQRRQRPTNGASRADSRRLPAVPVRFECQSLHRSPPHALAESERDRTVDRSHVHDHEGIRHARQAPNPSRHLSHRAAVRRAKPHVGVVHVVQGPRRSQPGRRRRPGRRRPTRTASPQRRVHHSRPTRR